MTCFALELLALDLDLLVPGCVGVSSSSRSGSWSSSDEERSFSRGRIRAESVAGDLRRGRSERDRVVARRRWLQKRQCWVRIGRVGFVDGGVSNILRVWRMV